MEVKIGDRAYIDCDSSFGASSCGWCEVTEVKKKFDSDTGSPYNQVKVGGTWFHGETGMPIDEHCRLYLSRMQWL